MNNYLSSQSRLCRPLHQFPECYQFFLISPFVRGRRGIQTLGTLFFTFAAFQEPCNKSLCHPSLYGNFINYFSRVYPDATLWIFGRYPTSQEQKDSNLRRSVLETDILSAELCSYFFIVGRVGFEPTYCKSTTTIC